MCPEWLRLGWQVAFRSFGGFLAWGSWRLGLKELPELGLPRCEFGSR